MDTILVTGGSGFIGSHFVRAALSRTPWRVAVVDKLTYAGHRATLADCEADPRFSFHRVDIADRAGIDEIFRQLDPAFVVNFAAETHVDRSIDGAGAFVRTNIVGAHVLMEAARAAWADRSDRERCRFIQVSTDEVYGALGPTGHFTEATPFAPNSPYAATKASADHLARAAFHTHGLPVIVSHCSNNYGPYQFPEKLIPLMILNALDAKPLPVYGDGRQVRDWLHVADHCDALMAVLEKGRPGETYNIGAANERENRDIVAMICEGVERILPAARNPAMAAKRLSRYAQLVETVADRPGHDRRYAIDATRARTELGWVPTRSFEAGLAETIAWYAANRGWCQQVLGGGYDRERLGLGARKETA